MELLDLYGCDLHHLEIFVTDRPGELLVSGGPGWPHRCETCNHAWVQARLATERIELEVTVDDRPRLVYSA